jgi:cyclopropane fatty-acyl-phospholipid synthase-like methyltransferase
MNFSSELEILDSWRKNVIPWVAAVRNGEINTRVETTNHAIIEAVLKAQPDSVLDLGCGEGWLVREFTKLGIHTIGTDAVPELIDAAIAEGIGQYKKLAYEDISYLRLKEKFDVVVSNFSLLGDKSVNNLFNIIPSVLNSSGHFIIQTIHPLSAVGNAEYKDGWREGSWSGFSATFTDPAPWYFRTLNSWASLFTNNGLDLKQIYEPSDKNNHQAASIIFSAELTS